MKLYILALIIIACVVSVLLIAGVIIHATTTQIPTTTTIRPATTTQIPTTTTIRPATTTQIPTTTTIRPATTTQIPTTTTLKIYNVNSPLLTLSQNSNITQDIPILFFTFPATGKIKKILFYCNNPVQPEFIKSDVRIAIYDESGIFSSSIYAFVYIDSEKIIYRTGYDEAGTYYINAPLSTTLINYSILDKEVAAGQKLGVYLSNNTSGTCSFTITGKVEYY